MPLQENVPPADGLILEMSTEQTMENIPRDLIGDLLQTFRLSHGQPDAQARLIEMLGYEYAAVVPEQDITGAWPEVEARVDVLGLPASHEPKDSDVIQDGYRAELDTLRSVMQKVYELDQPPTEEELASQATLAAARIMIEDERWQIDSRPSAARGGDPHASILRDYVVGDKMRASAPMLAVRGRLRGVVELAASRSEQDWRPTLQLNGLIKLWQQNHPDQDFWSGH